MLLEFPRLYPADETLTLVDQSRAYVPEFGHGLVQRVSRLGPRWMLQARFERLGLQERGNLMAFLSAVRGRQTAFRYWPRHSYLRGSFPAVELFSNIALDDTTGWTSSNAEAVLYADGNRLRVTRTGVTGNRTAYQNPSGLTNGAAYLLRAAMERSYGTANWSLLIGSTNTNGSFVSGAAQSSAGSLHVSAVVAATSCFACLADYSGGRSAGNWQLFSNPSFSRCALVSGGSQTGSTLLVDGLPASTNGLALAGDVCAVYTTRWELKRIVADLNSDGSGIGSLHFEPELSSAPADNAPVAFHEPASAFILAEDPDITTQPGMFSDVKITLMEVFE